MAYNILLSNSKVRYESHVSRKRKLPFIFHTDTLYRNSFLNVHKNIELLFFIGGNGCIRYDNTEYPVHADDVIVVNSYTLHQTLVTPPDLTYFCLIIDEDFCMYHNIDISKLYFEPFIHSETLNSLIKEVMKECYEHQAFEDTGIKMSILRLLLYLCRNHSSDATEDYNAKGSTFQHIQCAIEYIEKNIDKKITLDDIAKKTGLSKYYFLKKFKNLTGHTPIEYINISKCEYAYELLRSGKYTVQEVSSLCGFDNPAYFTNVFKKCRNCSPSEVLKMKK